MYKGSAQAVLDISNLSVVDGTSVPKVNVPLRSVSQLCLYGVTVLHYMLLM